MMEIEYKLDAFEGPLDLLLHLITKNKVSIFDIPIVEITNQYLDAICCIDEQNIDNSSEFIIMAAQLLYLKSKMLLPKKEEVSEEDDEDPREELAKRIEEYSYLKKAAFNIRGREFSDYGMEFRKEEKINFPVPEYDRKHEIKELFSAIEDMMKRKLERAEPETKSFFGIVGREKVPVEDMEKKVWEMLHIRKQLAFSSVFKREHSKPEKIATFLALLEMVKENKIRTEYSFDKSEYIIISEESV